MSERKGWLREAISDDGGLADMAYVVIGSLAVAAIMSLGYILTMSTVSYVRCTHIVDVGAGTDLVRAAIPCVFDPLPVGQASGLIFGAFATLIAALSAYMASTRRQGSSSTVLRGIDSAVMTTAPAPAPATAAEPLHVAVDEMPPAKPAAKPKPRRK